ncbi:MAG: glutaredoxin family protein [Pseudomonadota bacterium]
MTTAGPKIIVYTTPDCGRCRVVKDFLAGRGLPFEEKNVAGDFPALKEMVKTTGSRRVPTLVLDGRVVIDPDPSTLPALINDHRGVLNG